MVIKGKVHCMFEQSGIFKKEFRKLGYDAYDYDISNNFGETDIQKDLFLDIENAYKGENSIFDLINSDDLIFAFFPCTYFSGIQTAFYCFLDYNTSSLNLKDRVDLAIKRSSQRNYYHSILLKLVNIILNKNLRLIIENPASNGSFLLYSMNFPSPTIIDKDRSIRGDIFKKPTAYWFFNCNPTHLMSPTKILEVKKVMSRPSSKKSKESNIERSKITSDYARNFICDFIIGRQQPNTERTLFDGMNI